MTHKPTQHDPPDGSVTISAPFHSCCSQIISEPFQNLAGIWGRWGGASTNTDRDGPLLPAGMGFWCLEPFDLEGVPEGTCEMRNWINHGIAWSFDVLLLLVIAAVAMQLTPLTASCHGNYSIMSGMVLRTMVKASSESKRGPLGGMTSRVMSVLSAEAHGRPPMRQGREASMEGAHACGQEAGSAAVGRPPPPAESHLLMHGSAQTSPDRGRTAPVADVPPSAAPYGMDAAHPRPRAGTAREWLAQEKEWEARESCTCMHPGGDLADAERGASDEIVPVGRAAAGGPAGSPEGRRRCSSVAVSDALRRVGSGLGSQQVESGPGKVRVGAGARSVQKERAGNAASLESQVSSIDEANFLQTVVKL